MKLFIVRKGTEVMLGAYENDKVTPQKFKLTEDFDTTITVMDPVRFHNNKIDGITDYKDKFIIEFGDRIAVLPLEDKAFGKYDVMYVKYDKVQILC